MRPAKLPIPAASAFSKALAAVLLAAALAPHAKAESTSLSGFWSGSGVVYYSGGSSEPARCRALFSQLGPEVAIQAQCATPSGNLEQAAQVRQVGPDTYAGNFFNPQYNVAGTIQIAVRDKLQYVTLWSEAAAATLTLGR